MGTNYDQISDSPSKNSYIGSYYQPPDRILSVSRQLDLTEKPAVIPEQQVYSPNSNVDSQAVVAALKTLQEKIRKTEVERKQVEKNYQRLSHDAQKYQQVKAVQTAAGESTSGPNQTNNFASKVELDSKLQSAEARCRVLEKQLDYMRRMVENAKEERNSLKQDQASLQQQPGSSTCQIQRKKLEKLESECLRLSRTQTQAETKLSILEQKLLREEHERKLVQEKAEELQREFDDSLRLSAPTTEETKPKKKMKKKNTNDPGSPEPMRFPFVAGTSTSPSHSVHANVQSILHMMKHHQPQLCELASSLHRPGEKKIQKKNSPCSCSGAQKQESRPADQTLSSLSDLLLALQDELGQMSFEHQELLRQLGETERREERRGLEADLERLLVRMEEKSAHISKLRKHQEMVHKINQSQRGAKGHRGKKPGDIKPPAPSPVTAKQRPKNSKTIPTSLQLLRQTQKFKNSLKQEDLCWET